MASGENVPVKGMASPRSLAHVHTFSSSPWPQWDRDVLFQLHEAVIHQRLDRDHFLDLEVCKPNRAELYFHVLYTYM